MEEILNKINEMEQFEDRKNELDNKQADIKGKEVELKKLQEKRSMNISPITRPVLDEQIEDLESEIESLNESYKQESQIAREEFNNVKEELRNLIKRQKSLYKRKDNLDQEKAKGLEEVAKQRKEAEEEFSKRNEEIIEKVAEEWNKRRIYQQMLDDAKATHEKMVKAFSEGKVVDQANAKSVLEEITANEKKIKDIDSKISGMQQEFENDKQARMAEIDDYEDRINNYKSIEDNMEEIDDIEHLEMSLNSFTFDNVDVLKSNPVIASLRQRGQQIDLEQKQEELDEEIEPSDDAGSRESEDVRDSDNDEISTEEADEEIVEEDEQYDSDKRKALDSLDKTDVGMDYGASQAIYGNDDNKEQEESDNEQTVKDSEKTSLKGITIRDGITIDIEKDGETNQIEIDFKKAKKNNKMTENEKIEAVRELINDDEYFKDFDIDTIIHDIDPHIILGLKKASDYVPLEEIRQKTQTYLEALNGDNVSKKEMKEFITYDMRKRSRLSQLNFIKRISNYRYFRDVRRYIDSTKDLVTVIKDKAPSRLEGLLKGRKVKLLSAGKERIDDVTQNLKEKADNVKDVLDDTAARGKIRVSAFKKGYQVYQQEYQEKTTELDNEGVPQIPNGPDKRTQEEIEEDEKWEKDDEER